MCVKEVEKWNPVSNFRPITCLVLMRKFLAEDIFIDLEHKVLHTLEKEGSIAMVTEMMQKEKPMEEELGYD